jgi:hypothetical protein
MNASRRRDKQIITNLKNIFGPGSCGNFQKMMKNIIFKKKRFFENDFFLRNFYLKK